MDIISRIKAKKELSGISDEIVKELLSAYLKKTNISPESISEKDEKILIKDIRSKLRKYAGRFKKHGSVEKLIDLGLTEKALAYHSSTKERIDFYPELKKMIKKIAPKSILDLGCGLNPIAIADKNIFYYASDIDESNLNIVKKFFHKYKIKGRTFLADIRKGRHFPKADLCLILKVIDIVKMPHKEIESLLLLLNCPNIIVSFSTITLSGKPMDSKRRFWFERILEKLKLNFTIINSKNEIFYLIRK